MGGHLSHLCLFGLTFLHFDFQGGMRPMGPGMFPQQPMGNMGGNMGGAGFNSQPMGMQQQQTSNQSQSFDPFGSLG